MKQLLIVTTVFLLLSCKRNSNVEVLPGYKNRIDSIIISKNSEPLIINNTRYLTSTASLIDTFVGYYTDSIYANYGLYSFMFIGSTLIQPVSLFVTHAVGGNLIFSFSTTFHMTGNPVNVSVIDTVTYSGSVTYLGRFDPNRNLTGKYWQIGVDTINLTDHAEFAWEYGRPICADEEDHLCRFVGWKI